MTSSWVETPRLAVTISRQTGCGAHVVAEKLAGILQAKARTDQTLPWTVFDRNLVEKVLEDHQLSQRLARFMPEDRVSPITDTIDQVLKLHPPVWSLVGKTVNTILRLAEQGNVIIIGRGANVITSKLNHCFHIRLVGSIEKRVEHIQEIQGIGKEEALKFIREEDRGRQRYLRRYFGQDLDDPLRYHLVLNTDLVPYEETACIIGEAVLRHYNERQTIPVR